jgi:hypothetical protein
MVDVHGCSRMKIGNAKIDLAALVDLKRLLASTAPSSNLPSENGIARGGKLMKNDRAPAPNSGRHMSQMFEPLRLDGIGRRERAEATLTLAQILMQAAGSVVEELDDYQR